MIKNAVIIGSGKVASALALALHHADITILQVYSKTYEHAQHLAEKVSAVAVLEAKQISQQADIYLISVSDSAIKQMSELKVLQSKFVVHTAGSIPLSIINQYTTRCGVFYPLQTFSEGRTVNMSDVPFCIEASQDSDYEELIILAKKISDKVYVVNSEQRLRLHLSAVFANNFGNHMFALAFELLKEYQLPFDMLRPLIAETAAKLQEMLPTDAQTGPAVRGDTNTITAHQELLRDKPEMQKIYTFVSESIEQLVCSVKCKYKS
jgi:predicted short-subunit dehydrogenase-like oxidoreductase (DUF2520 family)